MSGSSAAPPQLTVSLSGGRTVDRVRKSRPWEPQLTGPRSGLWAPGVSMTPLLRNPCVIHAAVVQG